MKKLVLAARNSPLALLAVAALLIDSTGGGSMLMAAETQAATTSRTARGAAINAIPFDKLNQAARDKLSGVVSKPSIYRRMPTEVITCDPDLYLFLIRYPEVVINVWRLMGVTNVDIQRSGPYTYTARDGAGTLANVELVYGDAQTHVLYAEGAYAGKLIKKKINGRCVMLLRSNYKQDAKGRVYIENTMDVFLQLDNIGADLLAKSLHPLVGKTADLNFTESTRFVGRLSRESARNSAGVGRMANKLTGVDPKLRTRFADLAKAVGPQLLKREAAYKQLVSQASASERKPQPARTAVLPSENTKPGSGQGTLRR